MHITWSATYIALFWTRLVPFVSILLLLWLAVFSLGNLELLNSKIFKLPIVAYRQNTVYWRRVLVPELYIIYFVIWKTLPVYCDYCYVWYVFMDIYYLEDVPAV